MISQNWIFLPNMSDIKKHKKRYIKKDKNKRNNRNKYNDINLNYSTSNGETTYNNINVHKKRVKKIKKKPEQGLIHLLFIKNNELIVLNKKEKQSFILKGAVLLSLFFVILCLLLVKVVQIKVVDGSEYEKRVLSKVISKEREIVPQRGMILDRNEKILATSTLVYNIIMDPVAILGLTENGQTNVYKELAAFSGKNEREIRDIVESDPEGRYKIFQKGISAEEMMSLKKACPYGIWFEEDYRRLYPKGNFASQMIGFYSKEKEGRYGVEQEYDQYLKGVSGRVYPKLQEGNVLTTNVIPAKNGSNVILTIDEEIQKITEEVMYKYIEQEKPINASAIFMNPNTGEILSMFSYPSFDPNQYYNLIDTIGENNWESLSQEKQSELLNRSWKSFNIQYPYEPGSTFKPILISAMVDRGYINESTTFNCPGYRVVGDRTIRCHKRGGHGVQTLEQALANSCNVAMMDIGSMVTEEEFQEILFEYGFGQYTGIDIFGEAKGILHKKGTMGPVEIATSAFGQSFTTTPIQLITAFDTVINGGELLEPYIVSEIVSETGSIEYSHEKTVKRKVISKETSDIVRNMLDSVILEGTGSAAEMENYTVGGKTGTAEKLPRGSGKHILSFVGIAPLENPQVIGMVVFDEIQQYGGHSGRAFKEITERILAYLEVKPDKVPSKESKTVTIDNVAVVPELENLNINNAIKKVLDQGLEYEILGVGSTISSQFPNENTELPKGSSVKIYTTTQKPESVVVVPDLIGKTMKEAKEIAGSSFVVKGQSEEKTITSQIPKAGTKVDPSSELVVSFESANEEEVLEEETTDTETKEEESVTAVDVLVGNVMGEERNLTP